MATAGPLRQSQNRIHAATLTLDLKVGVPKSYTRPYLWYRREMASPVTTALAKGY